MNNFPAPPSAGISKSFAFRFLEFYGTNLHHPGMWRVHSFLRHILPVNVDEEIPVVRGHLKWVLNPSDHIHQDVFWCGIKDQWDVFHIRTLVKKGDTILDIGSNFGYYSVVLAAHLQKDCRIFAFEPLPENYARLVDHIKLNSMGDCIEPSPLAISDVSGESVISLRVNGNSGSASLVASESEQKIVIKTVSIDEFVEEKKLSRVDFLKVDVEGSEPLVLRGASQLIREQKPSMMVEFDSVVLRRAGSSVVELGRTLRAMGYSLFKADRQILVPFDETGSGYTLTNVFCLSRPN
jgi:FkbM family methyltransferase